MEEHRPGSRLIRSPWPLTLGLLVPLWLLGQRQVWRALEMGVVKRPVLELWVHGPQPGWLDWVPFIHPPGYSLFMNSVDAVARGADVAPSSVIFWLGGACALGARLLVVEVARRWFGGGAPALFVAALVILDPQGLRPFEHYPLAALLITLAVVALCWRPRGPPWVAALAVFAAVEVHLSAWFVLGPLLSWDVLTGGTKSGGKGLVRRQAATTLAMVLGAFGVSAFFGLVEVLDFGGGPKGDPGSPSVEWANPLLIAALLVAAAAPSWRGPALAILVFCGITWGLQALQLADGSPFPYSLHYFELIAVPMALVVGGAFATGWHRTTGTKKAALGVAAGLLVLSQWALFGRGLLELFAQARWILMVG